MAIQAVADLQEEVTPFRGQDCTLKYRVRTDKDLDTDETITGWALLWTLCEDAGDTVALLLKTTVSGITIATPYATVTLTDDDLNTLQAGVIYRMQLWRNDSGNTYPLTGLGTFYLQDAPPLV